MIEKHLIWVFKLSDIVNCKLFFCMVFFFQIFETVSGQLGGQEKSTTIRNKSTLSLDKAISTIHKLSELFTHYHSESYFYQPTYSYEAIGHNIERTIVQTRNNAYA